MTEFDAPPPPNDVTDDTPLPDGADEQESLPELTPLEAAQGRVAELEDKLRRTEAEFLNETKRIRKNAEHQGRFAIERVVLDLLPVIDAMHGASRESAGKRTDEERAHREGLELIERALTDALGRHGIERIDAVGQAFDPGVHEAMLVMEDDTQPAQTVTQEMRAGYLLHGRVVRPAQVIVTKRSSEAAAESDEGSN